MFILEPPYKKNKKKNADLRHRHRTSIRCIAAFLFH
uniref:Uncharacterized protein n=1 Tax=Siphoviridae sp. ctLOE2 TaxID=2825454 RepID=A0A8S5PH21_9CAUD|nr:MAG TPA: hypothetical protein [Siphoviridae sp. ctLOE2]